MRFNETMLSLGVLMQLVIPKAPQVTKEKHPPTTMKTKVQLSDASGSVFHSLLEIGTREHIPMGIVIGKDRAICRVAFQSNSESVSLADLIDAIHRQIPGYRAELNQGVLTVEPENLNAKSSAFLDLRLSEFRSQPESIVIMGANLWMFIRAVIAPGEGSAFAGGVSAASEMVPGIQVENEDVKTILDMIVDKGSGGVWTMDESKVVDLSPKLEVPYSVYGYVGNENVINKSLVCPTK